MKPLLGLLGAFGLLLTHAEAGVKRGTYRGTSQSTVTFLNPTTLEVIGTKRYARKLTVMIGAPKSAGGVTEQNPFSLSIVPTTPGFTPTVGDLYLASARPAAVLGINTLFTYWVLKNNVNGFSGSLIDSHAANGAAKDRIVAQVGGPSGAVGTYRFYDQSHSLGFGATLTALSSGRQLAISLSGHAYVLNAALIRVQTTINVNRTTP